MYDSCSSKHECLHKTIHQPFDRTIMPPTEHSAWQKHSVKVWSNRRKLICKTSDAPSCKQELWNSRYWIYDFTNDVHPIGLGSEELHRKATQIAVKITTLHPPPSSNLTYQRWRLKSHVSLSPDPWLHHMTSSGLDYCLTCMLTPPGTCWRLKAPTIIPQTTIVTSEMCMVIYF